jgi:hypothetical protein
LRENCDFKIANKQKRKTISILAHFHYIYGSFVQNQRFQSGVAPWDEKKKKKKEEEEEEKKNCTRECRGARRETIFFVLSLRLICPRFPEDLQQITWIIFLTPIRFFFFLVT